MKKPTIKVVNTKAEGVLIAKSIINRSVIQSIAILIKKENIPNVRTIIGSDKSFRTGRKTIFAAASTAPAIMSAGSCPVNSTDLINHADIRIASELANVHNINDIKTIIASFYLFYKD